MFHRIMVPFDGSARATDATAMASHLARRTGASLDLVHIESAEAHEREQEAVDRQMSSELTSARASGLEVETHREVGHVNETIIAACKTSHADLMVLAPHRRNRLSRMLPLGMTEYLLIHSPLPLLICPEQGQRQQSHPTHSLELLHGRDGLVICPLDGSDVAERALPCAIGLARQFERTLLLMRVIMPPQGFASGPQAYAVVRETQCDEEHEACHYLHRMRHRLLHELDTAAVRVETMLLSGSVAEEILGLSVAHEGSVLVMSTHGRSGLSRMVIGSVTSDVVQRTSVPMFVVPAALVFAERRRATASGEVYAMPAAERPTTGSEDADQVPG